MKSIEYSSRLASAISLWRGKTKAIVFTVLITLSSYLMLGAYPIVPLENDGMRIALGAQSKKLYGDYTYAYKYQEYTGAYKLIELYGSLTGLREFESFSHLSIISCVVFLTCSLLFLRRIAGVSILTGLGSLILFQETYVSGYYPNSTILAAALLAAALLVACFGESLLYAVLSGILFALSFWCRVDTCLVGGAFIVVLVSHDRDGSLRRVLAFLSAAMVTGILLYIGSGIFTHDLVNDYLGFQSSDWSLAKTIHVYSTILTLATTFLLVVGLYLLISRKNWRLTILTLSGAGPLIAAYGFATTSPKYILYAMIFLSIPSASALVYLFRGQTRIATRLQTVLIVLIVGQYIFTPAYELIIHRSIVVPTGDELRLRGAIAYTPVWWAERRRAMLDRDLVFQGKLNSYLQQVRPVYIISHDWMTNSWLLYFLQEEGYRITEADTYAVYAEDGQRLVLTRDVDTVYLVRWRPEQALDLPDQIEAEVRTMPAVLYIGPDYTMTDYAEQSFLAKEFKGQRLSDWGRFEAILFQH